MSIVDHRLFEKVEKERRSLNQYPYNCILEEQLSDGSQIYKMSFWIFRLSIVLSKENGLWHLIISGKNRKPSPRQIFIVQSELIPLDVEMEVRDDVSYNKYSVHLIQNVSDKIEAIKWLEKRGYERHNDDWIKGTHHIQYAYLPGESGALHAKIYKLKEFKDYVIQEEKHTED